MFPSDNNLSTNDSYINTYTFRKFLDKFYETTKSEVIVKNFNVSFNCIEFSFSHYTFMVLSKA
jgi:hypothetical protein